MSVAAIVSQLQALTCKAESLAEKFRQTCPTDDRYRTVEDLSLRLTKAANMFPAVVKELSEARKEEVRKESHKLSSEAQATRNDLIANCRLINPATFRRNIILTFEGPKNSTFDSRGIKSRKESTRKRCEQIRGLNYDGVVSWALAYPPTQWAAGFMAADIFNSLIETIEPEEEEEWPLEVRDMLRALGAEPPLQESTNYHQFLRAMEDRSISPLRRTKRRRTDDNDMIRSSRQHQNLPIEADIAPSLNGGTSSIQADNERQGLEAYVPSRIEWAFLVPQEVFGDIWNLHHLWAAREPHSIILTVPSEYRVASIVLSIPRANAIQLSHQFNLPTIFNSNLA